jgi:predicted transcriptional regulator
LENGDFFTIALSFKFARLIMQIRAKCGGDRRNRLMIDNGKRLKELIRKRGFRLGAVAEAIDVAPSTMDRWTDNAPIGKLIKLSRFTGIPILEVISCFDLEDDAAKESEESATLK